MLEAVPPAASMHRFKANYFPALDGLRGLAILLVITHHQLIPFSLKGGFLGVDLFFVLSGFLITTLLVTEFDATDTVSLKNFYVRRALRLGPALLLYLIASLIVTYLLQPAEFARELRLVGFALAYVSNWRLALGWDMSLDPTSIIWSLSIEEQFYLIWPVVLLICLSLRVKRSHMIIGLVLIIVTICLHRRQLLHAGVELNRLYYGTDTRADAPLIGCLIALISRYKLNDAIQRSMRWASVIAAGVLIYVIATVEFTDTFLYCGGYTAVAFLAAIITLTCAVQPGTLIGRILELPLLRWFGKISYSLYLWHWLLLKTTTFYSLVGPFWDPWARFAAAVAVSAFSFYIIERPFNRLKTRFAVGGAREKQPRRVERIPATPALASTVVIQPSE